MKIVNKTQWNTLDLKKLLTRTLNEYEKVEGQFPDYQRKRLTVEITTGRFSGYAYYNSHYARVRIPKPEPRLPPWWKKADFEKPENQEFIEQQERGYQKMIANMSEKIADVFMHELDHCKGYRHKQMPGGGYCLQKDVEFAKEYEIRPKAVQARPKRDLQRERYNHAIEMVKEAEKRIKKLKSYTKLAKTILKKWEGRVKYYEKELLLKDELNKVEG